MSTPTTRRSRARRGSGDRLRDEILDAATDLLMRDGDVRAVSIRSVAQRVGVTPPSIYLHFADKEALLEAVCGRYFEQLGEEVQRVIAGQTCTLDVLRAQALALIRFATKAPEPFRTATMCATKPGNEVDLALTVAFGHMCQTVQLLMDEGIFAAGDPIVVTLELWTVAHGVAAMQTNKPYLPFGDTDAFADRVITAVCMGQLIAGLAASDSEREQLGAWLVRRRGVRS